MSDFTCAECGETFTDGAHLIISNQGSDTICHDCCDCDDEADE